MARTTPSSRSTDSPSEAPAPAGRTQRTGAGVESAEVTAIVINCAGVDPETLLRTEWLLTDGAGGFAMGTALGAPARRYHGLLIGATRPPVGRVMAWNSTIERLVVDPGTGAEKSYDLSTFRFPEGLLHPDGRTRLERFETDATRCRWTWRIGEIEVEREVTLLPPAAPAHADVCVAYTMRSPRAARLIVSPLVSVRDFHALLRIQDGWALRAESMGQSGVGIVRDALRLDIVCDGGLYEHAPDWWRRFRLDREAERGQDCGEDLFTPGRFVFEAPRAGSRTVERRAALRGSLRPAGAPALSARDSFTEAANAREAVRTRLGGARARLAKSAPGATGDERAARLADAADQFVVARSVGGRAARTVLAGYPWFADWGRDTLIATPGLLLATGRFQEALGCLETFARHVRNGLTPNVFDDYTGEPHYNTVDASLWLLHGATEYARLSGDAPGFRDLLLPACLNIIEWYTKGTEFGVRVDPADGLVTAGDESTQLTWMDAKRDGTVFTPRHGKAIEINALWRHGLRAVAAALGPGDKKLAADLVSKADRAGRSIVQHFWSDTDGWLADCLRPGPGGAWTPVRELRPNQLFAVSLAHSPLSQAQQRSVVEAVAQSLVTPMGVRTLAPDAPGYRARYEGGMWERDSAYHNGTAWPWLMGPFVEALLRAEKFSPAARARARAALEPLLEAMLGPTRGGACLGQIAEVYDGSGSPDRPQAPGGCPAQAWSVAEVLRALALCEADR